MADETSLGLMMGAMAQGEFPSIRIRGARTHNLANVDVDIPRNRLTVITGPSGSGKSSLAFDTLYAEAQRRFVESQDTYARQFLEQLERPPVDRIEGLPPAVAVRQSAPFRGSRSTVGTMTEVHDLLRVLYARVGQPHCTLCSRPIRAHTVPAIVERAVAAGEGARLVVLAPLARKAEHTFEAEFEELRRQGFVRVVVDGQVRDLAELVPLDSESMHEVQVQVDRVVIKEGIRERLRDSIELALRVGRGFVELSIQGGESVVLSDRLACPFDRVVFPTLRPQTFSFFSTSGACPACRGEGRTASFDPALVLGPESIAQGAIRVWGSPSSKLYRDRVKELAKVGVDVNAPFPDLPLETRNFVLHGGARGEGKREKRWPGVLTQLATQWEELSSRLEDDEGSFEGLAEELRVFRSEGVCTACGGARLGPHARAVTLDGVALHRLEAKSITEARACIARLEIDSSHRAIAEPLLLEISIRLSFLDDVGVGYLSLDRSAETLSSGEAQRLRLATRIGQALVGVLYVLDEPSVGLHPRDTRRLIDVLFRLRAHGSTVVVVEHDLDVVRAADHVIDMGPGAGVLGGRVLSAGTPTELAADPASLTGRYLSGERRLTSGARPSPTGFNLWLVIEGARRNNLCSIDARLPVGALTAISGVSGSGKSSLLNLILDSARAALSGRALPVDGQVRIAGSDLRATFDRVVSLDDRPIGRNARSVPATFVGVFGPLRELFATLPEARARGWGPARFSFNQRGGRCEVCKGEGVMRVDMQFLPDVTARCEACEGTRYDRSTLEVRFRGISIADVLAMSALDAREMFSAVAPIREKLDAMVEVGLGYVTLGQSATTLSGGEAQRLALSKELARRSTGRTLYLLDEPTTGLHLSDIDVLLDLLRRLVRDGNTVVLVEHALEVVASADWVIDLGPDGGPGGGRVVAEGSPQEVAKSGSATGTWLADLLM